MQKRDARIEALRVFLMLSIVFGHFACHGIFHKENLIVQTLDIFVSYGVGTFAFISGWYSVRFSVSKFVRFLCLGLFYSIILWLLTPVLLGEWYFSFSLGWFGNSYLALMLLASFLNAGVEKMHLESPKLLFWIWGIYAVYIFVSWLPLQTVGVHVVPSGWASHTVNTLLFMYLTGRVFSMSELIRRMPHWAWVVLFLLFDCAYVGWSVCGHFFRNNGTFFGWLLNSHVSYMHPFLICASIAIFFVFLKLPSERFLGWTRYLAPSMFSVYLLHGGCNSRTDAWLYRKLETTLAPHLGLGTFSAILNITISALLTFILCTAIDLLRRTLIRRLARPPTVN